MLSSLDRFTRLPTWPVPCPPHPITPMRMRSLAPKAEAGMTLASEVEPAARAEVLTNSRRESEPRCGEAGWDDLACMIGGLIRFAMASVNPKAKQAKAASWLVEPPRF